MKHDYEVLIIGGGPAGLSAALTLGRISRSALICDDGKPRNEASSHVNNFITRDGIHPNEWRKEAKRNLEKYKTIHSIAATVSSVQKDGSSFIAALSTGETVNVKKVILAYGVRDKGPAIPGFKELWGKSIFHCPFCHGFEVRGQELGFIANGEGAFHALPLIHSLASNLILFTDGKATFTEEKKESLKQKNIKLIEQKIVSLSHQGTSLEAVMLEDGTSIQRKGLFYFPQFPFDLKSCIGAELGCEKTDFGFYKVNERNGTTVPGVFACGDNMSMAHSVLLASASGVVAGSGVIFELLS